MLAHMPNIINQRFTLYGGFYYHIPLNSLKSVKSSFAKARPSIWRRPLYLEDLRRQPPYDRPKKPTVSNEVH